MSTIQQTRITLTKLKVAQFNSEETLCFSATVVFDGVAVGTARNEGHGGPTSVDPLKGMQKQLAAAEAFAKSLPDHVTDLDDHKDPTKKFTIKVDLEYLVDVIAGSMEEDRHLRRSFKSSARRIQFVVEGELRYVKKVDFKKLKDPKPHYDKIRLRYPDAKILNELPKEEAFQLYKTMMLAPPKSRKDA
jgi:hypothetical protein